MVHRVFQEKWELVKQRSCIHARGPTCSVGWSWERRGMRPGSGWNPQPETVCRVRRGLRKQMVRSLGWSPQTRRRCWRGGAREPSPLRGHQKRPRLEKGPYVRPGVDALRAAPATLAGGPGDSGVGADCQRGRGWKGGYRISRTSCCKAVQFLCVHLRGSGALWEALARCGLGERKPFL